MHCFLCIRLCLQGEFKTWLDHTPLRESSWYDPKRRTIAPMKTTVYFRKHSTFSQGIIQPSILPDMHVQQPERTNLKNCSAAIYDTRQLDDPAVWIVIPCDKPHDATFVCQSNNETALLKSDPSNLTCESGWFGLQGSPHCFILMETLPKMYFYEAVNLCLSLNSSILIIDAVPRTGNLQYEQSHLLQHIANNIHMKHSNMNHGHIPEYVRDTKFMANIFIGMAIAEHHYQLLNILYRILFLKFLSKNSIAVFADVHNRCGIIQYSDHTRFFRTSEQFTLLVTGWGAKFRFCSESIEADALVCVRPSEAYNTVCKAEHFQCSDKTCVLGIYVCDGENDCFDGKDENGCLGVNKRRIVFSLRNNNLYLPCPLHLSCKNNVETLFFPVKIHAICDGIISDKLLLDETILCGKRDMVHIDLLELISIDNPDLYTKGEETHYYEDHFKAFDQDYHFLNASSERNIYNRTRQIQNPQPVTMKQYELQCDQPQRKKTIDRLCKINSHDMQCAFSSKDDLCRSVTCSGMFKCQDFYCISMSSVCDGQIDCLHGEDEMSCFNLTCPGALKCRGENRCVGLEEVCNGKVDCIFSYDDEISCSKCSDNCLCEGYILHCDVRNTLNNEHFSSLPYAKALVLEGVQNNITMDYFYKSAIIFFNVSYCRVKKIMIKISSHVNQHLLFNDLSNNKLNDIRFLSIYIFRKLVVIDLSHNVITDISLSYNSLKHLKIIDVSHNPLKYLYVDHKLGHHNAIYMNNIPVYVKLEISASANPYAILEVFVSDSTLCCMLNKLKCTSATPKTLCFGLMESKVSKVIFYILVFVTSAMILAVIIKHILLFSKSRSKLYYNISQLNHLTASLISVLCYVALASVDIANIYQWKWKTNPMCLLINAFLSMSLSPMSIFKILALMIIQMKIIFPFKHQCRWLNGTGLCCFLTWFSMVVLYGINIIVSHLANKSHTYDKLCSIGDCHTHNFERFMVHFVCFINVIFLLCFFVTLF